MYCHTLAIVNPLIDPAPPQGDPLRKFYTSLLEQRPESEMARKWCVMNGLLSAEDAQAYVNAVAARKGDSRPASRAGNGAKATPAKRAAPKSAAGAKKTTPKGAAAAKKGAAKATPKKSAKAAATKTVAAKRASPGGSGVFGCAGWTMRELRHCSSEFLSGQNPVPSLPTHLFSAILNPPFSLLPPQARNLPP